MKALDLLQNDKPILVNSQEVSNENVMFKK
jgi:hypothetical protein